MPAKREGKTEKPATAGQTNTSGFDFVRRLALGCDGVVQGVDRSATRDVSGSAARQRPQPSRLVPPKYEEKGPHLRSPPHLPSAPGSRKPMRRSDHLRQRRSRLALGSRDSLFALVRQHMGHAASSVAILPQMPEEISEVSPLLGPSISGTRKVPLASLLPS